MVHEYRIYFLQAGWRWGNWTLESIDELTGAGIDANVTGAFQMPGKIVMAGGVKSQCWFG
jgi:hypothetical protein